MGLLPCWVCFTLFFSLDWVCNLLFRIDVGLFFLGRLALLPFFFFKDFSSKFFLGFFFFWLLESRTNKFLFIYLRVFLIFFLRVNK